MLNKKKVLILSLTLMLFAIASTALVSFSLAGDSLRDSEASKASKSATTDLSLADSLADSLTNVDHIIEKSNDTSLSADERVFKIVQIVSDTNKETSLKKYIDDGSFRTHVINNNKSASCTQEMLATLDGAGLTPSISLQVFTIAELNALVSAEVPDYTALTTADLFYVNNVASAPFADGNDIPNEVYEQLKTYVDGDYKPLIVDYVKSSSGGTGSNTTENQYTMAKLTKNVLSKNFIKFNTFSWQQDATLVEFLTRAKSVFVSYKLKYTEEEKAADPKPARKVLFVTGDTGASAMKAAVDADNANFIKYAYYRKSDVPTAIETAQISYTALTETSFDGYDFVFIENDTYANMTADIYNIISTASYAKKHVIYAKQLETSEDSSSSDKDDEMTGNIFTTNYDQLLALVAPADGISIYSNVMLSTSTMFETMAANPTGTQELANEIADLLKSSTYREYGKNSASGKLFTVLEIQPAYPIDQELATKNNNYYSRPDAVYKQSKEMVPEGSEYYAFEMTMEKLCALTGLESSQINLVQVSTEELQGMKDAILGTYDLIYIGGNMSALRTEAEYQAGNWATVASNINSYNWTFYRMFSHSGTLQYLGADGTMGVTGGFYGSKYGNYVNGGGNDISYANFENLKAYVDAGMPLIISDDVTDAYVGLKAYGDNPYKNLLIDPDCNMLKFLGYALEQKDLETDGTTLSYDISGAFSNVLAGFDKDDIIQVDNIDKKYGGTITPYAVVFNDGVLVPEAILNNGVWEEYEGSKSPVADDKKASTAGQRIIQLLDKASKRPILNISNMPAEYKMNTPTTYLQKDVLNFEFTVLSNGNTAITGYTVNLYIDDNSNGLYTDKDELVLTKKLPAGTEVKDTISYDIDPNDEFYGPVSWKLEIVANPTGMSISYDAVSYVERLTREKTEIRVLQINTTPTSRDGGNNSFETLYFCPICQLSGHIARYNPISDNAGFDVNIPYADRIDDPAGYTAWSNSATQLYEGYAHSAEEAYNIGGKYHFGLHDHEFGIWKYDQTVKYDDWTSNLADQITGEDGNFNIDIDIFSPADMDAYIEKYNNNEIADLQKTYEKLAEDLPDLEKQYKAKVAELTELEKELADLTDSESATEEEIKEKQNDVAKAQKELEDIQVEITAIENAEAEMNTAISDALTAAEDYMNADAYKDLVAAEEAAEKNLRAALEVLAAHPEWQKELNVKEYSVFQKALDTKFYFDIFSAQYATTFRDKDDRTAGKFADVLGSNITLNELYIIWADASSERILYEEKYWDMKRAAYGKNWLKELYGIVLIGASENFSNKDLSLASCDYLEQYESEGGNMLMFHDTMTRSQGGGAINLTDTLKECFGLDRYHMELSADENSYVLKEGYDSKKYFMTHVDFNNTAVDNLRVVKPNAWSNFTRTMVAVTPNFSVVRHTAENQGRSSIPHKYVTLEMNTTAFMYSQSNSTFLERVKDGMYGTNRAKRINDSVVTSYPFTVSDTLWISNTHNQYLTLDIEDGEVIPLYTLSATNNHHNGSSIYAANPGDSADNYFIYSKGNVTYCGAGHSKVTGALTNNNDERMLFINIICNSARKSALNVTIKPEITLYDPDTEKIVPHDDNEYILVHEEEDEVIPYIEVANSKEEVKFGFKIDIADETLTTVENVKIYFKYTNDDGDEVKTIIHEYPYDDKDALEYGETYFVETANDDKLEASIPLKDEYFDAEDYAYLYIEATQDGETTTQLIRIELAESLFDLTQNDVTPDATDVIKEF